MDDGRNPSKSIVFIDFCEGVWGPGLPTELAGRCRCDVTAGPGVSSRLLNGASGRIAHLQHERVGLAILVTPLDPQDGVRRRGVDSPPPISAPLFLPEGCSSRPPTVHRGARYRGRHRGHGPRHGPRCRAPLPAFRLARARGVPGFPSPRRAACRVVGRPVARSARGLVERAFDGVGRAPRPWPRGGRQQPPAAWDHPSPRCWRGHRRRAVRGARPLGRPAPSRRGHAPRARPRVRRACAVSTGPCSTARSRPSSR